MAEKPVEAKDTSSLKVVTSEKKEENTNKLTLFEKLLMEKVLGEKLTDEGELITDDASDTGEPAKKEKQEVVKDTKEKEDKQEKKDVKHPGTDAKADKKKETLDLLASVLGMKKTASEEDAKKDTKDLKAPETDEEKTQLSKAQKELAELRQKENIRQEVDLIHTHLENFSEEEAKVIMEKINELIGSETYVGDGKENPGLIEFPVDKRVAAMILTARGMASDNLKQIVKSEEETKKEYEALLTTKTGKNESDLSAEKVKELQKLARMGDRDAAKDLAEIQNQAYVDKLVKSLGT